MLSHNTITLSEPVSVPADHQDPNHPHYQRDLDHQSDARRSFLTKKRVLIAGSIFTILFTIVASLIWGVALTRKTDNNSADAPTVTVAANVTTSAPPEIRTVFENATTFVYLTTRLPLLVTPSLATSTIVLAQANRTPDPPLRPIVAEAIFAKPNPSTLVLSEAPVGDISITGCFFDGAWALKEQCEKHCPTWDGHETHCEVSKRSQWVCVSCPL